MEKKMTAEEKRKAAIEKAKAKANSEFYSASMKDALKAAGCKVKEPKKKTATKKIQEGKAA